MTTKKRTRKKATTPKKSEPSVIDAVDEIVAREIGSSHDRSVESGNAPIAVEAPVVETISGADEDDPTPERTHEVTGGDAMLPPSMNATPAIMPQSIPVPTTDLVCEKNGYRHELGRLKSKETPYLVGEERQRVLARLVFANGNRLPDGFVDNIAPYQKGYLVYSTTGHSFMVIGE